MNTKVTILSLAALILVAPLALAQWETQTVDNSGNVGTGTSIAYDSQGNPHIVYVAGSELRYTFWNGATWQAPVVIHSVSQLGTPCLVIDSNDDLYVVVRHYSNKVRYYWRSGTGDWHSEEISNDCTANAANRTPLVFVGGVPHVVYWSGSHLRHAYRSGSTWISSIVDTGTNIGQYASLAADAAGRLYASYYDGGGGDLKFAYRNLAGEWHAFRVDGEEFNTGQYTSLVLDRDGIPHICYYDVENRRLMHAVITDLP